MPSRLGCTKRLGTRSAKEAEEWARILPNLPEKLIPASELVNKLLSEFISSKQGHVVSVARVLMRVSSTNFQINSFLLFPTTYLAK
jgi:hypothetical protein